MIHKEIRSEEKGGEEEELGGVDGEEVKIPIVVQRTRREWKDLKEEILRSQNDSTQSQLIEEDWKVILVWTNRSPPEMSWESVFARLTSGECEESRCRISYSKMFASDVDAILFSAYDVTMLENKKIHLPKVLTRNSNQVYVFYSMEPPNDLKISHFSSYPQNFFNWTMGFRPDSDVINPFGKVIKRDKKAKITKVTQRDLEEKKMAAWVSSLCYIQVFPKRDRFLRSLSSLISVDNLQSCSGKVCKNGFRRAIYGRELDENKCDGEIKNYVFYLALERYFCSDYISERVFKAWKYGAIPVVFGDGNYSSIAPPNSYIDSRDFDSVDQLAEYMTKVASDSSLYNKYFKWKEDYEVEIGIPDKPFVCDLCRKLHEQDKNREEKSYADIFDWFVTKGGCPLQTQEGEISSSIKERNEI